LVQMMDGVFRKIGILIVMIPWKSWLKFTLIFTLALMVWVNYKVYKVSSEYIKDNIDELPSSSCALLLGTSKELKDGRKNLYFVYRINSCVDLYRSGKIKNVLISGDNSRDDYNEPEEMKRELMRLGIPEQRIYLDYAGFDTYDSVIRAWKIFGQSEFIVVSQKFHNQRAVYIARENGINAYGLNAQDVHKMNGVKTKIREYFACVKAYFDVFLNVDPYFLGQKEKMR
jgi:SanA protein